ncbi:MAG: hypothetical protein HY928_14765 [Elusimicrobia bacterium]|nr:hypothetical protein [Elusimicrobiota bacterium]
MASLPVAAALVMGSAVCLAGAQVLEQAATEALSKDGAIMVQTSQLNQNLAESAAKAREATERAERERRGGGHGDQGRDHDRDRDHGRDRDRDRDHGRDRDRDHGRDHGRDHNHDRDHGRDRGRDDGRWERDGLSGNDCWARFYDRNDNGLGELFGACSLDFKAEVAPFTRPYLRVWAEGDGNRRELWSGTLDYHGSPRFWDDNRDGRGTVQGRVRFDFERWRGERWDADVSVYAEAGGVRRRIWQGEARSGRH